MGIKGFFGFCKKEITTSYKQINFAVEIKKYQEEHQKNPVIVINLNTLCHHFNIKKQDFLCGYQLIKIKCFFEDFLSKLKDAGGELIFFWRKEENDDEFLSKRLQDYMSAREMLKKVKKIQDMEKLVSIRLQHYPYNILILVCLIQSAKKFGKTFQIGSFDFLHSITQTEFATIKNATWLMGLDTNYFFMPGEWKILSDESLNIQNFTIDEFDKNIIMQHLGIEHQHFSLFATLTAFQSESVAIAKKVVNHFGLQKKFMNIAKFVQKVQYPLTDESFAYVAKKIFGPNYDERFVEELKKSIDNLTRSSAATIEIEGLYADLFKDDFPSYAHEILTNKSIFISPVFLDLESPEMKDFNSLVLPWIQKTAGILLKNSDDKEDREIILLKYPEEKFVKEKLEVIYPSFEVPELKSLLSGEYSMQEKMAMLYWILEIEMNDTKMQPFFEEYLVDSLILLYLVKKKLITRFDANCTLKALFDSRQNESFQYSTEYPSTINSQALRCTLLYGKVYYILHSCLACLGVKNFCPEIQFDGVYLQKMYAPKVTEEEGEKKEVSDENENVSKDTDGPENIPIDNETDQNLIVKVFAKILNL